MLSGLLTAIHQPGFCKAIQIRRKTSASNKARINFLHVRQTSFSYNIPKARRRASSTRSIAALLLNRFASVNSTAHTGWGEFLITWRAPSPYWLLLAGIISISTFPESPPHRVWNYAFENRELGVVPDCCYKVLQPKSTEITTAKTVKWEQIEHFLELRWGMFVQSCFFLKSRNHYFNTFRVPMFICCCTKSLEIETDETDQPSRHFTVQLTPTTARS